MEMFPFLNWLNWFDIISHFPFFSGVSGVLFVQYHVHSFVLCCPLQFTRRNNVQFLVVPFVFSRKWNPMHHITAKRQIWPDIGLSTEVKSVVQLHSRGIFTLSLGWVLLNIEVCGCDCELEKSKHSYKLLFEIIFNLCLMVIFDSTWCSFNIHICSC